MYVFFDIIFLINCQIDFFSQPYLICVFQIKKIGEIFTCQCLIETGVIYAVKVIPFCDDTVDCLILNFWKVALKTNIYILCRRRYTCVNNIYDIYISHILLLQLILAQFRQGHFIRKVTIITDIMKLNSSHFFIDSDS